MIASEEIAAERREAYEESSRILLARLMSEKGGMLTKGFTEAEIESKALGFLKELFVLQSKFIDVIREDWGFDREDESATFGEDIDNRWMHFVKNHIVKDEQGNDTILYSDKNKNYRLINGVVPQIKDLEFIIKNYNKIYNEEKDEVEIMPSITLLGVEGVSSEKYEKYNLDFNDKDFYLRQVMILICELIDMISKHKKYLKEEKSDDLFKLIEEKFKDLFN